MCLWRSDEMEARIAAAAEENDVYDRLAKSIAPEVRHTSQLSYPYKSHSVFGQTYPVISAMNPSPPPFVPPLTVLPLSVPTNRFMGTWT